LRKHLFAEAPENLEFSGGQSSSGEMLEVTPQIKMDEEAFVWIQVEYRGPFGDDRYTTSACWRYDGLTNRLVQWGDDEYNYSK
jgi:hypothetical protein